MTWKEVETIFNRALSYTFSRKKLLFTAPILIFCGLVSVCFRLLGAQGHGWLAISMKFMPLFFCSSVLLAAGIVLIRVYHHEVKGLPLSYRKTFQDSKNLMTDIAYLALPVVLIYLALWTLLGVFYLFKEIPIVGDALSIVLSFGPFLLLLGSFLLSVFCVAFLFFVTPSVSLKSSVHVDILKGAWQRLAFNPFTNVALLLLSLLPGALIATLMTMAARMTGKNFVAAGTPMAIGLQWFFIMIPFSALLAPAVVFFFNFAVESHVLMVKKMKDQCALPS